MIFLDPTLEAHDDVHFLGTYHRYKLPFTDERNPSFDEWSRNILNLKNIMENPEKQRQAIQFFLRRLDPMLAKGFAIVTVPGHDATKIEPSGIRLLAQQLAANGRIDGTGCLVRHTSIDKQATGGRRSIDQHLQTIHVMQQEILQKHDVLLLDDVWTTGCTIQACHTILLNAGAKTVKCVVLGKTYKLI